MICINDNFTTEQMEAIPNRPIKDEHYSIRDVVKYMDGRVGYLLNEIHNPPLDRGNGFSFEPTFGTFRFVDDDLSELFTEEKIEEHAT